MAYHLGREREAKLMLKKVEIEAQLLNVNEAFLSQVSFAMDGKILTDQNVI